MAAQKTGKSLISPKLFLTYLASVAVVYLIVSLLFSPEGLSSKVVEQVRWVPSAIISKKITVDLLTQNNSGQSGSAVFTEVNGKTKVVISFGRSSAGVVQPAHIHAGSCPGVGRVLYPLNNVINGKSETTLNVTLAKLKKELPLAVNVHKSVEAPMVYVACGPLK